MEKKPWPGTAKLFTAVKSTKGCLAKVFVKADYKEPSLIFLHARLSFLRA